MQDLAHATAHLMHGSSEGRFTITYAPGHLSQAEIEGVNFRYADINETIARYRPEQLQPRLEHDGRRRAVLFHPHAVGRAVGDAREALQSRQRVCRRIAAVLRLRGMASGFADHIAPRSVLRTNRCRRSYRLCCRVGLACYFAMPCSGLCQSGNCNVGFHAGEM